MPNLHPHCHAHVPIYAMRCPIQWATGHRYALPMLAHIPLGGCNVTVSKYTAVAVATSNHLACLPSVPDRHVSESRQHASQTPKNTLHAPRSHHQVFLLPCITINPGSAFRIDHLPNILLSSRLNLERLIRWPGYAPRIPLIQKQHWCFVYLHALTKTSGWHDPAHVLCTWGNPNMPSSLHAPKAMCRIKPCTSAASRLQVRSTRLLIACTRRHRPSYPGQAFITLCICCSGRSTHHNLSRDTAAANLDGRLGKGRQAAAVDLLKIHAQSSMYMQAKQMRNPMNREQII